MKRPKEATALETSAQQLAVCNWRLSSSLLCTNLPLGKVHFRSPTSPATGSGAGFVVKNGICYDANAAPAVLPRDDERERAAHRGIRWAGLVLAVGIVLEVVSTVWTFQKALSAGAFLDNVDCRLHASRVMQETCDTLSTIEPFHDSFTSRGYASSENPLRELYHDLMYAYDEFGPFGECFGGIDTPDAGKSSDLARCVCDAKFNLPTPCWWAPVFSEPHAICIARAATTAEPYNISTDDPSEVVFDVYPYDDGNVNCRPMSPSGTFELGVTSLVVALGSQLVEAVVGFKYLVDPRRPPALMTAATIFEALGVAAMAAVMMSLPGFFEDEFFGLEKAQRQLVFYFTWAAATTVIIGAAVEWSGEHPDRWGQRHPHVGAFGNALVWLGAATLEVVVAAFQTWRVTLSSGWYLLANELAGLVAVELSALLSMWLARFLWTMSKDMLSPVLADGTGIFRRQKNSDCAGLL